MSEGFAEWIGAPARQGGGKIATTKTTDAIIDSLDSFALSDGRFEGLGGRLSLLKIVGNETGGGYYKCEVWEHAKKFYDPTTNTVAADFEAKRTVPNAVYFNLQEIGLATHDLTHADNANQKYFLGFLRGYTAETKKRLLFVGNALWLKNC